MIQSADLHYHPVIGTNWKSSLAGAPKCLALNSTLCEGMRPRRFVTTHGRHNHNALFSHTYTRVHGCVRVKFPWNQCAFYNQWIKTIISHHLFRFQLGSKFFSTVSRSKSLDLIQDFIYYRWRFGTWFSICFHASRLLERRDISFVHGLQNLRKMKT
jgi:hypothetical protein